MILFGMVSALVGSYFRISGVSDVNMFVFVILHCSPFCGSFARRVFRVAWLLGSARALLFVFGSVPVGFVMVSRRVRVGCAPRCWDRLYKPTARKPWLTVYRAHQRLFDARFLLDKVGC